MKVVEPKSRWAGLPRPLTLAVLWLLAVVAYWAVLMLWDLLFESERESATTTLVDAVIWGPLILIFATFWSRRSNKRRDSDES